jgi:hypothetical protein
MTDIRRDPRGPIDVAIKLAGTGRADRNGASQPVCSNVRREQITIAPDFAPTDAQPAWRQDFRSTWPQDLYVEASRLHEVDGADQRRVHGGQVWIGVQNWWAQAERRSADSASGIHRTTSQWEGAVVFTYPNEHEPWCCWSGLTTSEFVGLRPEVHSFVLRP